MSRPIRHRSTAWPVCALALACWHFSRPPALAAPPGNPSDLPPAAAETIDFHRDIKPILESSCLRCHGPDKPRSGFRLDNRLSALKGGEHGVDILPGASTNSPLIYYVAGLAEDIDMPPPGKGEPLTPAQVGQLRAWIDQGANWDTNAPAPENSTTVAPTFGGTAVSGNRQKFRELNGPVGGLNGGLENFQASGRPDPDTRYSFSGHWLLDDYKLELSLDRNNLGFIHSGWEQWRRWQSDTGGYFPAIRPAAPDLGRDLFLDYGKAWVDFGLTLPHWPQMKLGYEYDYKQGEEAATTWGALVFGDPRAIAPAAKNLDEATHAIKFNLDHDLNGAALEERFRGEFYDLRTSYTNNDVRGAGGPTTENARAANHYFQGANTIRLEKKFNDWVFVSAGWLYSQLNSDASFSDSVNNNPAYLDSVPNITLEKNSHVFNLNTLLGPLEGLSLSAGVQPEWTLQHGLGGSNALLNPVYTNGASFVPATQASVPSDLYADYYEKSVTESAALRFTKIPFTVLFWEGRLQQRSMSQYDYNLQSATEYQEDTAFRSQESDIRAGFNTSPWRGVTFDAHYRRHEDDSHYDNNQMLQPGGYPGLIQARDLKTDEVEAKLTLHPFSWLRTFVSYKYLTTSSWTDTDPIPGGISTGGGLYAAQSYAQVYSINATMTPSPRLFVSTTFSYQPSSTTSSDNNVPTVAPYRGDMASAMGSVTYALSRNATWFANYSFSEADYAQDNYASGLPLGIEYRQHSLQSGFSRRFGNNIAAQLKYGYYCYNEPTSGGANNFSANSVFATVAFKWP